MCMSAVEAGHHACRRIRIPEPRAIGCSPPARVWGRTLAWSSHRISVLRMSASGNILPDTQNPPMRKRMNTASRSASCIRCCRDLPHSRKTTMNRTSSSFPQHSSSPTKSSFPGECSSPWKNSSRTNSLHSTQPSQPHLRNHRSLSDLLLVSGSYRIHDSGESTE